MEAKKTLSADLTRKRELFFSIGLVISMLFVITVFEWKTYDDIELINIDSFDQTLFDETLEIPPTVQPPPPPPAVQQVAIIEVPDNEQIMEDIEIDLDIEITEEAKISEYVIEAPEIEEEDVDEIFTIVESSPEPPGGYKGFYEEVGKKIIYPKNARRLGIEGKVFVEFVVDKTGELTNIRIVKGINPECDEEAIRVLKTMPKWKSGKQRGRAVKVKMVIPITYKLK